MRLIKCLITSALFLLEVQQAAAHSGPELRRPISPSQPAWIIHIDVWNNADPQKIIDLVPEVLDRIDHYAEKFSAAKKETQPEAE